MAKKCPTCGKKMEEYDAFYTCDECDVFIYKRGYEPREEKPERMPAGCSACGNPAYPDCKSSCSLFDD